MKDEGWYDEKWIDEMVWIYTLIDVMSWYYDVVKYFWIMMFLVWSKNDEYVWAMSHNIVCFVSINEIKCFVSVLGEYCRLP